MEPQYLKEKREKEDWYIAREKRWKADKPQNDAGLERAIGGGETGAQISQYQKPKDELLAILDGTFRSGNPATQAKLDDSKMAAQLVAELEEEKDATRLAAEEVPFTYVTYADIVATKVDWLWKNYLAKGQLFLLYGDPDQGKSMISMDWVARVSSGRDWPDGYAGSQGKAIVIQAEDVKSSTIKPRLIAAGAKPENVISLENFITKDVNGKYIEKFFTLNDLPELEKYLINIPDIKLITIDPMAAYIKGTNSHQDAEVRQLLTPLAKLAEKYNVCVVLVTHCNKPGSRGATTKAIYRAMGSIGIIGGPRTAYLCCEDPREPGTSLMVRAKNNLISKEIQTSMRYQIVGDENDIEVGKINWMGTVAITADEALTPEAPETKTDYAEEWLKDRLTDAGEVLSSVITEEAKKVGITNSTLWRAKDKIGVKAKKQGFSKTGNWLWSLPIKESKANKDVGDTIPLRADDDVLKF